MDSKTVAIMLFGCVLGLVTGSFGIHIHKQPIKYLLIVCPSLAIFMWLMSFVK